MATYSKTINNGWGVLNLELRQESQNIGNNTSTVYYKLYLSSRNNAYFFNNYHTGKTSVVINGSTVHNQTARDFNVSRGGSQQLASGTTTVKHNEDGSKSFSFSASIWASNFSGSISGNFSLTKIPRKSDFTVKNESGSTISSFYAGDKVYININKKVSSFTHTLSIKYLGKEETLISKTSSSTIYYSNSNKIMENYMQNLRSTPIDFVVNTYDGNTSIGYVVKRLTLNVPSSASPTINSVNVTEANQNKINIIGSSPFYQHLTDLGVKTSASGKYGASIKNVSVNIGSYVLSGTDVILKGINLKDSQSIKVTVKDTRDMSASTTRTINLNPYNLPNISFFNAYRNQSNTKYASARISLTSTVIDNKNPLDIKIDVAEKDTNSWKNVYSATVGNGKFNDTISLGGGFDDFKAYDVRLSIADKFKRHQALSTIPATSQSLVIGADKPVVGIGKVPTIDKGLEIEGLFKMGDFTTSISGNDIVFKNNKANGSIKFENNLKLDGDIAPGQGKKIINVNLSEGLSGYLKLSKDAFGLVHMWADLLLQTDRPAQRWNTWAKIPEGYCPSVRMSISFATGGWSRTGLALDPNGNLFFLNQDGVKGIAKGDPIRIDYIYRNKESKW